ncbi:Branched-chain amino acid transport protein (AzlD) [Jatrophihabitans endophyticus]|uniref:Branched-chain amino acid transport protein (AzlD) n=1 Tax=Jatrophihabitans endophyticus TaxID=1206085 RepID=A0A1M5RMN7_9ACTN|nr:AzlD domain-containing protein [Jatrophihabitans endophyticus]SHH27440.1 Branched-chain amino acid transport protein (AzlD) [Jatrophihabitans endophyticus]
MTLWVLVAATALGCYLEKVAGYLVPADVLARPRVRRVVELLPVALLAALVVVQAVADGRRWDFDGPRLAGVAAGALAVWRRAPFLVVVLAAAATAALLRLLG